jgi:anti-sigma factor RsiW
VATRTNQREPSRDRIRGLPSLLLGAIAGAVLVLGIAAVLGGLIEGLAAPAVLVGFAAAGAIFGAFAWGAVAYDRRSRPPIGRHG